MVPLSVLSGRLGLVFALLRVMMYSPSPPLNETAELLILSPDLGSVVEISWPFLEAVAVTPNFRLGVLAFTSK